MVWIPETRNPPLLFRSESERRRTDRTVMHYLHATLRWWDVTDGRFNVGYRIYRLMTTIDRFTWPLLHWRWYSTDPPYFNTTKKALPQDWNLWNKAFLRSLSVNCPKTEAWQRSEEQVLHTDPSLNTGKSGLANFYLPLHESKMWHEDVFNVGVRYA